MSLRTLFSRGRRNPRWLVRIVRIIGDYRFYRNLNHSRRKAWKNAKGTI